MLFVMQLNDNKQPIYASDSLSRAVSLEYIAQLVVAWL